MNNFIDKVYNNRSRIDSIRNKIDREKGGLDK